MALKAGIQWQDVGIGALERIGAGIREMDTAWDANYEASVKNMHSTATAALKGRRDREEKYSDRIRTLMSLGLESREEVLFFANQPDTIYDSVVNSYQQARSIDPDTTFKKSFQTLNPLTGQPFATTEAMTESWVTEQVNKLYRTDKSEDRVNPADSSENENGFMSDFVDRLRSNLVESGVFGPTYGIADRAQQQTADFLGIPVEELLATIEGPSDIDFKQVAYTPPIDRELVAKIEKTEAEADRIAKQNVQLDKTIANDDMLMRDVMEKFPNTAFRVEGIIDFDEDTSTWRQYKDILSNINTLSNITEKLNEEEGHNIARADISHFRSNARASLAQQLEQDKNLFTDRDFLYWNTKNVKGKKLIQYRELETDMMKFDMIATKAFGYGSTEAFELTERHKLDVVHQWLVQQSWNAAKKGDENTTIDTFITTMKKASQSREGVPKIAYRPPQELVDDVNMRTAVDFIANNEKRAIQFISKEFSLENEYVRKLQDLEASVAEVSEVEGAPTIASTEEVDNFSKLTGAGGLDIDNIENTSILMLHTMRNQPSLKATSEFTTFFNSTILPAMQETGAYPNILSGDLGDITSQVQEYVKTTSINNQSLLDLLTKLEKSLGR